MVKKFSLRKRVQSFAYAAKGIRHILIGEHNMWIHLLAAILVVITGLYVGISPKEWIAVVFCIGMVIAAELFNSAIEKLVDLVSPQYHQMAGLIKDIAAGAVLVTALMAAIVGLIIFIPYFS